MTTNDYHFIDRLRVEADLKEVVMDTNSAT
jgi:hypothetical protein